MLHIVVGLSIHIIKAVVDTPTTFLNTMDIGLVHLVDLVVTALHQVEKLMIQLYRVHGWLYVLGSRISRSRGIYSLGSIQAHTDIGRNLRKRNAWSGSCQSAFQGLRRAQQCPAWPSCSLSPSPAVPLAGRMALGAATVPPVTRRARSARGLIKVVLCQQYGECRLWMCRTARHRNRWLYLELGNGFRGRSSHKRNRN